MFLAAYIFDEPHERETGVGLLVEKAVELGYQVRYWWLSDAVPLWGSDRLIVCVRHLEGACPELVEGGVDAGMNLYRALKEAGATWDELEAAAPHEWELLGREVHTHREICLPGSTGLLSLPASAYS
ncbi:MAG: hypothetical protein SXV54_20225 [Chloroflexota bacterium]|nr:hypothetical protein [Chloroflexota bacterium]